ncbi:hypothetical protein F5H01DRAFT_339023 [Linnemannia elongata]|nr:hypothetical protein F5H01DRAFT_339023 [Linnemannia elongata]
MSMRGKGDIVLGRRWLVIAPFFFLSSSSHTQHNTTLPLFSSLRSYLSLQEYARTRSVALSPSVVHSVRLFIGHWKNKQGRHTRAAHSSPREGIIV